MNPSRFFITHPRFSGVIAVLMVLIGTIAGFILPISQYPQITPPQIIVEATYPGANAQVLVDTVAVPIENQINGVEGMLYMSSTANDSGTYQLTITFNIGVDPDIAQVKVENRLDQVKSILPEIVTQEGLSVKTQSANMLAFLVLESPGGTYDSLYLSNFAYTNIQNPLERIPGISAVSIFGPQNSIRIWMNPEKITALGLSANTIIQAIESQNNQAAIGSIGSAPTPSDNNMVLALTTMGLLSTPEQFEDIIISSSSSGGIVRLKDVARVEIGADNYQLSAQYNGKPAVIMELNQTPNSNSLSIMKNLRKEMAQLKKSFPDDIEFQIAYDSTAFVYASIAGILSTLAITFGLVIMVVFLFLQNAKATLIPMITIPVSLIATFMVIYAIGFDINILTLFAMILAIGLVVDDAIIVVERVQYLMKYRKMKSTPASIQAMKDIASSIIATTLVLLSIFIPVALMAGITGKIYQQFAVTIATAIVFSAINALTLSPALCAIFLRNEHQSLQKQEKATSLFARFNQALNQLTQFYLSLVHWLCAHLIPTILIGCFVIGGIIFGFNIIPSSFIPEEDQGVLLVNLELPDTATINQTGALLNQMSDEILKVPGVKYFIGIAGNSLLSAGGENIGMGVVGLKPWDERKEKALSLESINARLSALFADNPYASIEFFAMPAIPGVGTSNGLSFQLNALNNNTKPVELYDTLEKLLLMMNQDKTFAYAFSTFTAQTPHLYLDIDRTKLEFYDVPLSNLFTVLQNNLGSRYVNNITVAGQINKVIVQADYPYRKDIENIDSLYVLNNVGKPIQIKEFIRFKTTLSPKIIYRFNQYLSAAVTAQTASGVSTGTGITQTEKLATELGNQYTIAWTGLSLQEVETTGLAFILIAFAFIFSYLFLVALYESWLIPFSVILTNIFAISGALLGLKLMHLPLSIYAQLGIVLLIGLASKNAILIVQFMITYRRQGMDILTAALKGANERYRAVLMTALTFILGVMPMIFASGAGAASQISMGTTVFFGMIAATLIGVLFVPALFTLFDTLVTSHQTVAPKKRPQRPHLKRRKK